MKTQSSRNTILSFVLGALATIALGAGAYVAYARLVYSDYKEQLARSARMELSTLSVNPAWIISGNPVFRIGGYGNSADKTTETGLWECVGPGKFIWHYGVDESIHILEGSVQIEYLGKTFTLKPGESTHFAAGTKATWTVNDRVKKTFAVYRVNLLTKIARRLSI